MNEFSNKMIECVYRNNTNKMVIMKCIGESRFYLEKVVMPKEMFWFQAPQEARLELWLMSPQGQMLDVRAYAADYAMDNVQVPESAMAS